MKKYRSITALMMYFLSTLLLCAQDVIVTITPAQPVLPPQVLLYVADPGKFFNITLMNTTQEVQQVYLGLQLEQTTPASDLAISTPPNRQPEKPFVIQPNATYQLTTVEMTKLFDHIPSSEIQCPADLFTNYQNGSFGLLPEGQYTAKVTAYKWNMPQYATPVVASNPEGGWCMFTVCYKAQAPTFLTPALVNNALSDGMAEVDPLNTQFTWTQPVITCGSTFANYTYDLKIVEWMDAQQPDEAMDFNPVIYQATDLLSNICIIPQNIISTKFSLNKKYLAQVTASPGASGPLNYVMLENNGKSTFLPFKFKAAAGTENDSTTVTPKPDPKPDPDDDDGDGDGDGDDPFILLGKTGIKDSIYSDKDYTFRNPSIVSPSFNDLGARKLFLKQSIDVSWRHVLHLGGDGLRPDSLKFSYEVQLFNGGSTADRDAALETEPIYTKVIESETELEDSIPWEKLEDKVVSGDYMVLRIKPTCLNGESVGFTNDSVNVIDFAMVESLVKQYFECSDMVDISNETPINATADELTGEVIKIGEYELTIDEIKAGKEENTWEGKGRVEWNPLGTTVMVCVKFSDLMINTDKVVFKGMAQSYSKDPESNNEIVEKLFSDWGIDNLIADTGIPYADYLQTSATDGVKSLAEQIDLSKYYEYVVVGKNVWNMLGEGNIDELYMPIALPDSMTKSSPVNIQITTMKFAATHATMDLIGEFVLPNTDVTKDQILVFGAPRLCISPETILPESGTLALLSDLTLKDPKSTYTCTFKAPQDLLKPVDGCYVSWHNYEFEMMGMDMDMKIPGLKKDIGGVMQEEEPVLNIKASVGGWEDWMADRISMDPFQIEDHPGWTFTASDIVYDHSIHRNSAHMGKFPKNYDKTKDSVLINGQEISWQGLYIGKIGVKMPKALVFGDALDRRFTIEAREMFFDRSGATLTVSGDSIFAAKTAKAGGWSFSLDHVSVEFLQSNFNNCKFGGTFDVPLIDSEIGYSCQIIKVNDLKNSKAGNYAYIFKTQQVNDSINFDFFLAKAHLEKELTYLLVEAEPDGDELKTKVELLMGGSLEIGGKERLQSMVKDIGLDFSIPDVHFAKMRLANCSGWESKYESELQKGAQKAPTDVLMQLYKGKEFQWGDFYFHTGEWSLASEEKFLGPFAFSLSDYDFDYQSDTLQVYLQGTLKFVEEIEISATAGIKINAVVTGLDEMDFSKLNLEFGGVSFSDAAFHASFGGMEIGGTLKVANDKDNGKGFAGTLLLKLPGNLFSLDAKGGYYEKPEFTWGYFDLKLSGQGLRFDPIVISGVHGGFYFNCVKKTTGDNETDFTVVPEHGTIGVILGITISTSAGEDALSGEFEMTVVYASEAVNEDGTKGRLSTFMFTGTLKAVGGLVDAKASILYENNDMEQFFALNVTMEAGLSGDKALESVLGEDMKSLTESLHKLNDQFEDAVAGITAGLSDLSEQSDENVSAEDRTRAKEVGEQAQADKDMSLSVGHTEISIDLRITMKKEGKKLDKVKWHLYIGEPAEDKRCKFTVIDFESPIVTVNIGANAYLCLGNELPGDGELPDIPAKVQQFLDGSTKGAGVKSDDMNKAHRGRTRALENFKADVSGGIMLGASAWGIVDVDLGLFYANMTAMAGFDISLRHMTNMTCMNFDRDPGYHGWYGEGQIYAYLAASMGLKLDLGFWSGEFPVLDAGIGGVFRMGGINPNYFTGAARVKLKAFAGLVDINRKFEFECGDVCDLFYGNALDNFELFGECSLGDTLKSNGWSEAHMLDPYLAEKPSIETLAPLDEHFRVIDETEYQRMLRDWEGDAEALKAQANRTFVFHKNATAVLYEYNSDKDSKPAKTTNVTYDLQESFRTRHVLNMFELNPNKFYKLDITGYAKELHEGVEDDPRTYNTETRERKAEPWIQKRSFYFRTGDSKMVPQDSLNLQDYVALAYPSSYGELTTPEGMVDTAYVNDVASPIISFKRDISETYYQGEMYKFLQWQLCDEAGKVLETRANQWITAGNVCVMSPNEPFSMVEKSKNYQLRLVYLEYGNDTVTVTRPVGSSPTSKREEGLRPISHQLSPVKDFMPLLAQNATSYAEKQSPILPAPIDENHSGAVFGESEYRLLDANLSGASPQIRIKKTAVADSVNILYGSKQIKISKTAFTELNAAGALGQSSTGVYGMTAAKFNAVKTQLSAATLKEILDATASKSSQSTSTSNTNSLNMSRGGTSDTEEESTLTSNVDNEAGEIPLMKRGGTSSGSTSSSSGVLEGVTAPSTPSGVLEGVTAPSTSSGVLEGVTNLTKTEVKLVLKKETVLLDLKLHTVDGNWQTGYKNKQGKRVNTSYEVPFLGIRAIGVKQKYHSSILYDNYYGSDAGISAHTPLVLYNGKPLRLVDPYWYISYLSNFAFIGGWRIQGAKIGVEATTSQSLIYTDLGGIYEGFTDPGSTTFRIKNQVENILKNSIYIPTGKDTYPLPIMEYDLHAYRKGGDQRTPVFVPSTSPVENVQNALYQLRSVNEAAKAMNTQIKTFAKSVSDYFINSADFSIAGWTKSRTGVNLTTTYGDVKLEVPYYQFGVLWGSQYKNSDNTKNVCLHGTMQGFSDDASRAQLKVSQEIWLTMAGRGILEGEKRAVTKAVDTFSPSDDYLEWVAYDIYRVNVYNCSTRKFIVMPHTLPVAQRSTIKSISISNPISDSPKAN